MVGSLLRGQPDDAPALREEKRRGEHVDSRHPALPGSAERPLDLIRRGHGRLLEGEPRNLGDGLESRPRLAMRGGVGEQHKGAARGHPLGEELQPLGVELGAHDAHAGGVALRVSEVEHQPGPHQIRSTGLTCSARSDRIGATRERERGNLE
jgi:hypothetical protein